MSHSNTTSSLSELVNFVRPILVPIMRGGMFLGPNIVSEPVKPQHFHFARIYRGDSLYTSLARHEHYLATFLQLKPEMRLLELGCGTGGTALELANFANVTILGVDADPSKIHVANTLAQRARMSAQVAFLSADFLRPQDALPAESFDGVYAIEALKLYPTFETCFREIRRLLKPGGQFAIYEWCWTSSFNSLDPDHCRLAELIETSTNIGRRTPQQRSIDAAIAAIQAADLHLIHHEDLTVRGQHETDDVGKPWYFPLEVALSDTRIPWHVDVDICGGLNRTAATILVEAGKRKLFTPMTLFVGQRPR